MRGDGKYCEWVFESGYSEEEPPVVEVPMGGGRFRFETIESELGVRCILANGTTGTTPVDFRATDDKAGHELGLLIPYGSSFQISLPGVPERRPVTDGHCSWHLPAERWVDYHLCPGETVRAAGLTITPELVDRLGEGRDVPSLVRAIERQSSPSPFEFRGHLGDRGDVGLRELFHAPYSGGVRRVFMESKLLELVASAFDNLTEHGGDGQGLSAWEIGRVRQAAERLLQTPADPPTMDELARACGLPVTRLMAAFRAYYGTTPVRWLQREKLEIAHRLLQEEPIAIKVLAFRLGYRHVSNFTLAFKRRFGYPPGAVRKGR